MVWPSQSRRIGPAPRERAAAFRERWLERVGRLESADTLRKIVPSDPPVLEAIFGRSPYLSEIALTDPESVAIVDDAGPEALLARAMEGLAGLDRAEPAALKTALRRAKRRASFAIALADIFGVWPLDQVTGALSSLAEATLKTAVNNILLRLEAQGQLSLAGDPDAAGLTILGMGKLGARELNYSSDVDLILLYDRDAPAVAGDDSLGAKFVRAARELVTTMSDVTADGYVFRTDLRLRPDPGSTPLAMSTLAAETYYESVGQNWERAAMIKARPVAGNLAVGAAFLDTLRPYIWRKHLDFAAIEDIHSIKRQIQAHRGGGQIAVHGHNLKLGRGGIREIEFFVQTQQLIWGGRKPELRGRGTIEMLAALADAGLVARDAQRDLVEAYRFLRRVEHRLQMVDDRQTHTLPNDDAGLDDIADFLGYRNRAAFSDDLLRRLRAVEGHYARLFETSPSLSGPGNLVFTGTDDDPETLKTLAGMGFREPSVASGVIRRWHHGRYASTATRRARELLTEFKPALLQSLAATADPDQALIRFDEFLRNLPAGVQPFSLFRANPRLFDLVAGIMGGAPRLAMHLARKPSLLDHVLSSDFFAPLPSAADLVADLSHQLSQWNDEEAVLDAARRWTNDRRFQIGAQQLSGTLDAREAGRAYADLAQAAIGGLTSRVTEIFEREHGSFGGPRLAVVGLGKLGSRDMTATSDLDLIFIYELPAGVEQSSGPKPLSPIQYYTRLSQRIVNSLTAPTNEGRLYETDMRLRPSGNAGPLACSLEAFETYQRDSAWTWEHMALTRARVLHGPDDLVVRIGAAVDDVLRRPRDPELLLRDVADMRRRIATHLPAKSVWDVKRLRGGMFDLDFIVQYLLLLHAPQRPALPDPDMGVSLDRLEAAGLVARPDAALMRSAYRLWNRVQHLLRLALDGSEADFDESQAPEGLGRALASASGVTSFGEVRPTMMSTAEAAYEIYRRIVEEPAARLPPADPSGDRK